MRIFVDTEFFDTRKLVHPLSFGVVREDGQMFYAEVEGAPLHLACDWVRENVLPHLCRVELPINRIRDELTAFVGESPEFWGLFPSYDWLLICQLYGRMMDTPSGWPRRINDIEQLRESIGFDRREYNLQVGPAHHALSDALYIRDCFGELKSRQRLIEARG